MSVKKTFVSSVAMLTIMFAGAVAAQDTSSGAEGAPKAGFQDSDDAGASPPAVTPVPNMEAQAKTEKMLKQDAAMDSGSPSASKTATDLASDPVEQAKTGEMLKEQKALDPND